MRRDDFGRKFGVTLDDPTEADDVARVTSDGARSVATPMIGDPDSIDLFVMTELHSQERRLVWWLVKEDVTWVPSGQPSRPGEERRPDGPRLARGDAVCVVDAATGEILWSAVWGTQVGGTR